MSAKRIAWESMNEPQIRSEMRRLRLILRDRSIRGQQLMGILAELRAGKAELARVREMMANMPTATATANVVG
jgi:hypothetical protein